MQLNNALARQIADKANQVLKRNILITNLAGQILVGGSGRRHSVAEALSAAQTGHSVSSEFEDRTIKWWPFVYEEQTIA